MNRIWKRYFFKEVAKIFTLFVSSFYFIYILIDYSTHAKIFHSQTISFLNCCLYYLCQFTHRADILIPVALTVAVVKVLTTANIRNEILALTTGAIPIKKILSPFFLMATLSAIFLFLNFQFLQPYSIRWIDRFEQCYFQGKGSNKGDEGIKSIKLEDNSTLIYQCFKRENRSFFDVYWFKNERLIYRIHSLFPYEEIPLGRSVDILEKKFNGELMKTASHETFLFPDLHIDSKILFSAIYPPRMQSISNLVHALGMKQAVGIKKMTDREAEIATFFYFKLTAPLVCFLIILGTAPLSLQIKRTLPVFFIFAISIFGVITFFTFTKAAIILGKHQVLPPLIAILLPQTFFYFLLVPPYAKL